MRYGRFLAYTYDGVWTMRSRREITTQPLKEPVRINVVLEKETLKQLKEKALYSETTVNEIVRSLIADYLAMENEAVDKETPSKKFVHM